MTRHNIDPEWLRQYEESQDLVQAYQDLMMLAREYQGGRTLVKTR